MKTKKDIRYNLACLGVTSWKWRIVSLRSIQWMLIVSSQLLDWDSLLGFSFSHMSFKSVKKIKIKKRNMLLRIQNIIISQNQCGEVINIPVWFTEIRVYLWWENILVTVKHFLQYSLKYKKTESGGKQIVQKKSIICGTVQSVKAWHVRRKGQTFS